jgi:SOS-response transcriptional repressor LexA
MTSNAVADHLKALGTKGYIKRDPLKARSIQVLTPPPVGMQGLPAKPQVLTQEADERKGELIRVRVTNEQKDILSAAAERAGLDVSSWLRAIGLREAQRIGAPRPNR